MLPSLTQQCHTHHLKQFCSKYSTLATPHKNLTQSTLKFATCGSNCAAFHTHYNHDNILYICLKHEFSFVIKQYHLLISNTTEYLRFMRVQYHITIMQYSVAECCKFCKSNFRLPHLNTSTQLDGNIALQYQQP